MLGDQPNNTVSSSHLSTLLLEMTFRILSTRKIIGVIKSNSTGHSEEVGRRIMFNKVVDENSPNKMDAAVELGRNPPVSKHQI